MELGISTFGEVSPDGKAGKAVNAHRRMKEMLEEVKLADEVGLDVFAMGEHHRPDFIISAPEVMLAAAAAITKNIKLSSAVTVLSSADPVRTFQGFASLDLLSDGRAEIMAGRGSFIESFPLFGYDLGDYDELFIEKLDLLMRINESEKVNWKGTHRAAIPGLGVYPRPLQEALPIWLAVGGTPASAVRAGNLQLPMALAILGGNMKQYVPFVDLYKQSWAEAGHDASKLQLAINTHFYLADNSNQAADELYPSYIAMMNRIGRERGWGAMGRPQYDQLRSAQSPLIAGSPQEAIDKILYMHELFGNTRYLAHMVTGSIPHEKIMHSIEIYGTVVAPAVRKALGH
ncbi:LLM class flavin-dependent oxidoreductase [Sediminibacterium ginsengisoli]|uniref:Probable oxidoreductase, LLM family n=1 Tax=Sediminibacterium ginsengisoli TaxID=413434 RepID=A0A1T4P5D7_9BACT|nr:LLM class flavin-dependent oxidoreductase [Sediminibacterium ginsengisoli]SJZ86659.1 probable oxidoreductase, LLM family [Sediminibacterium ginsengisoli]